MNIRNTNLQLINGQLYYRTNSESDVHPYRYYMIDNMEEVEYTTLFPSIEEGVVSDLEITKDNSKDVVAEIIHYLKRYIYLPTEEDYLLIAIIIVHSYCVDLFDRTPYLWIQGEKGSGKTLLTQILKGLVFNPFLVSETSAAALFRIIDTERPTLFLDEVEELQKRNASNQQIFQIMNSGYQKDGCVTRVAKAEVLRFMTYGLKIIAGINPLMSTLEDRCILQNMVKPPIEVKLEVFNTMDKSFAKVIVENIHSSLRRLRSNILQILINPSELELSDCIRLREHDKWFPLLLLSKVLSGKESNYFALLHKKALDYIDRKSLLEAQLPEKMCESIIRDFISDRSTEALSQDKNHFLFPTVEIQKVILANDVHNTYRNKSEITLTLKRIGIETDRRRFGNGPVSLYKIPKSILN